MQGLSDEAAMSRKVRPGRVIVLDDCGRRKGCGTAWKRAEDGHNVIIVTPDALVGNELQRMSVNLPLRHALARLVPRFVAESAIRRSDGKTARIVRCSADMNKTLKRLRSSMLPPAWRTMTCRENWPNVALSSRRPATAQPLARLLSLSTMGASSRLVCSRPRILCAAQLGSTR